MATAAAVAAAAVGTKETAGVPAVASQESTLDSEQQQPPKEAEQPQPSVEKEPEKDIRVSVQLEGVELLLLDDLRASVVPLVQARLSVRQLRGDLRRQRVVVYSRDMLCGFDFLNVKSGTWEPFIEQLTITTVYRRDLALERKLLLQQQKQQGSGGGTATDDQWSNTKAARAILISSYSPFLVNLTPQLCRLLAWFVPYLLQHIQGVSRGSSINSGGDASNRTSPLSGVFLEREGPASSSGGDAWADRRATVGSSAVHAIEAAAESYVAHVAAAVAAAQQQQTNEAPYRYLNLTGECLYAFTLASQQQQQRQHQRTQPQQRQRKQKDAETDSQEATGRVMVLAVGGSASQPLEALMEGRTAEASRSAQTRQKVLLAFCPPVSFVQQVADVLPEAPISTIIRSLLLTRDPAATINFLVESHSAALRQQQQLEPKVDPGSPLPPGMQAVLVDVMKSRCVTLLQPMGSLARTPPSGLASQLQQQQQHQRTAKPISGLGETRDKNRVAPGMPFRDGGALQSGGNTTTGRTLGSPLQQQQQLAGRRDTVPALSGS